MSSLNNFSIDRIPRIIFGEGKIKLLPELVLGFGKRLLLMTGGRSFRQSDQWQPLMADFESAGIEVFSSKVTSEPSPQLIDEIVNTFYSQNINVVVAIGGGSVLDAAKAVAGLLPFGNSVLDHLEGVGKGIAYSGPALPFIALPTTAGTGSEATKNAVLSDIGVNGYKKSFRHDSLVPEYALLDPNLLTTCPPELIAGNGMDALTQLIESYVSSKANPMMDSLALSGIEAVKTGLFDAYHGGDSWQAKAGRGKMAYAAMLSGITLAQVGLGSVHGLASPLGAFFPIPHGVVCGTLLASAISVNIQALQARDADNPALKKYATLGRLLSEEHISKDSLAQKHLIDTLTHWCNTLKLPNLRELGVNDSDLAKIIANARGNSMQTNPIKLTDDEIELIMRQRMYRSSQMKR